MTFIRCKQDCFNVLFIFQIYTVPPVIVKKLFKMLILGFCVVIAFFQSLINSFAKKRKKGSSVANEQLIWERKKRLNKFRTVVSCSLILCGSKAYKRNSNLRKKSLKIREIFLRKITKPDKLIYQIRLQNRTNVFFPKKVFHHLC